MDLKDIRWEGVGWVLVVKKYENMGWVELTGNLLNS
jgi:hypothetical protein